MNTDFRRNIPTIIGPSELHELVGQILTESTSVLPMDMNNDLRLQHVMLASLHGVLGLAIGKGIAANPQTFSREQADEKRDGAWVRLRDAVTGI
jgi:hypothetical protein